jgi:hypothetical protein
VFHRLPLAAPLAVWSPCVSPRASSWMSPSVLGLTESQGVSVRPTSVAMGLTSSNWPPETERGSSKGALIVVRRIPNSVVNRHNSSPRGQVPQREGAGETEHATRVAWVIALAWTSGQLTVGTAASRLEPHRGVVDNPAVPRGWLAIHPNGGPARLGRPLQRSSRLTTPLLRPAWQRLEDPQICSMAAKICCDLPRPARVT